MSVKTRLGLESPEEFGPLLEIFEKYPLHLLIIHPRVRKDFYSEPVRIEAFSRALEMYSGPVCYNGGLVTAAGCCRFQERFPQVDRVMIGQGLLADPALAAKAKGEPPPDRKVLRAFHDELYQTYLEAFGSQRNTVFHMKELWSYLSRLFEDSTHSTDTETREAAFYTLSGLYMMNGEAGRALDAVEKLPQPDYDARMLKASILRQTGQAEEAEKLHQTCLWGYVRDAGLCLYSLSAEARARGDTEKALALLDAACRLDVLFHGENAPGMHGNYELARAELLALAGKTPAALDAAEAYAESAVTGCRAQEYSPLFFNRLSSSGIMDVSDGFLRENALFVLESSEPLHALKQEPRYAALLERLKAAAGTKPDDAGRKAN